MAAPIIQVKELRKVYRVGGEQVVALDNVNFIVETGQVVCVVGTSGSGKSTLLNMLAGLEKPTRGAVLISRRNISRMGEDSLARFRQKYVGFVFQSYNLMQYMTALENVALPLTFRGMSKSRREHAAKRILTEVGLTSRMRHTPNQMSGGQQQRVGIARAFVANPKIIFADEPTGNLDTRTTIEVMRMMVRLCRENNQTLILVTHDIELAQYADRIITIIDGNIIKDVPNISVADSVSDDEAFAEMERKLAAERAEQEIRAQEAERAAQAKQSDATQPQPEQAQPEQAQPPPSPEQPQPEAPAQTQSNQEGVSADEKE